MSRSARGRFITLEGSEGVGKTTNLAYVASVLTERGITVLQSREPGGTALGEQIRDLLLHSKAGEMTATAELLLMFAARALHLEQVIKPALARGDWVVCDRFTDATYAYQGSGRGIDSQTIGQLEQMVQQGLQPDLTIWLDADPEITLQRRALRGAADRFEAEEAEFFARVRVGYAARAAADSARIVRVDAGAALDQVQNEISKLLDNMLINN